MDSATGSGAGDFVYASVCSGIGAPEVAWSGFDWKLKWVSEIESFPSAVLSHHLPEIKNHGDFTAIDGSAGPVDLLVGGTPCQAFSVAGKRKGLADARGNLAIEYVRLAQRLRARWVVWENVPGVLSSNKGADFAVFLGSLTGRDDITLQEGSWGKFGVIEPSSPEHFGVSWRVLDAQNFGVPQRRRRVFLVGYLGDWRPAAAVFLERKGMPGDHPEGGRTREEDAGNTEDGIGSRVFRDTGFSNWAGGVGTLRARDSKDGYKSGLVLGESETVAFHAKQDPISGDVSPCLGQGRGSVAIAFQERGRSGGRQVDFQEDKAYARLAPGNGGRRHEMNIATPLPFLSVRRLTPTECERLQGFPTFIDRLIIEVCTDHQNRNVSAVLRCLRSPSNALPAEGGENCGLALSADAVLWNDQASRESLVAVHVRSSHEPKLVAIRSQGRFHWCASGAGQSGWSLQGTGPDDFAVAIAAARQELANSVRNGKEESLPIPASFTLPADGRWLAAMSGRENAANASDVASRRTEATRFITSSLDRSFRPSSMTAPTWLSCVLNATSLFIQEQTPARNSFRIVVDVESDWTLVPFRGKPAADGVRYKAIGNSMAVPCMRWIGERIRLVESIVNPPQVSRGNQTTETTQEIRSKAPRKTASAQSSSWVAKERLRPPIKIRGGKHYLARRIIERFTDHEVYTECFGGGRPFKMVLSTSTTLTPYYTAR